ncbi:MAG: 5-(carboxyamino)imidazole ribonucleotide synthase [Pseudomonadota bacterium]
MRIGIIGGGQLGRMLALAGTPLGMSFTVLDPGESPCASEVAHHVRAAFNDADALRTLIESNDAVTFEFENIPAAVLEAIATDTLQPPVKALLTAQDRQREKQCFEHIGLPVAPWRYADSQQSVDAAIETLGLPLIAKTATLGYDGKGQQRLKHAEDAADLFAQLGSVPLLIERLVDFEREVSIVGTRNRRGDMVIYPITQNIHRNGILHRSQRIELPRDLKRQGIHHLRNLANTLDYVGTLALECFVCDNVLLGNEFAPRVHNTGHWTLDGTHCSQFENHLRAVADLPLGSTLSEHPAGMLNLVGQMPPPRQIIQSANTFLHAYNKAPRPGRKLGHINVIGKDQPSVNAQLDALERELGIHSDT